MATLANYTFEGVCFLGNPKTDHESLKSTLWVHSSDFGIGFGKRFSEQKCICHLFTFVDCFLTLTCHFFCTYVVSTFAVLFSKFKQFIGKFL